MGSYEGLTIKDMLDNGFETSGYMAMSMGDSGAISVQLTRDIELVSVNFNALDMTTYEEFSNLETSEARDEYIEEHLSDTVLDSSNYTVDYRIFDISTLQRAVEMGVYKNFGDAQGKTLGELLDAGYEYDGYSSSGDDCLLTISNGSGKYIMLVDRSEKNEELDLFMGDAAELLRDYTILEAYMFNFGSNTDTDENTNTKPSTGNLPTLPPSLVQ